MGAQKEVHKIGARGEEAIREGDEEHSTSRGAQGRNRTTDTAIFSRMLYQLSYLGQQRRFVRTVLRW